MLNSYRCVFYLFKMLLKKSGLYAKYILSGATLFSVPLIHWKNKTSTPNILDYLFMYYVNVYFAKYILVDIYDI